MSKKFVHAVLDEIRRTIKAEAAHLKDARARRDTVLGAAEAFEGALRTFPSGSIAHGTANQPANDADCGLVLNRTKHPTLGPDGDGVGSEDVVNAVRDTLREPVKAAYPDATFEVTKRAILVRFGDDGPTVDLVVGLNRKDAAGLWIPHTQDDAWDASDPETHTSMIRQANTDSGMTFARAARVLKAWNGHYGKYERFCSFNIEALALACGSEANLVDAVIGWFAYAEADVARQLTPDPAGVSDPIKLPNGWTRESASARCRGARINMRAAVDADTAEKSAGDLRKVFLDFDEEIDRVLLDFQLDEGNALSKAGVAAAAVSLPLQPKTTNAWGPDHGRNR